MTRAGRSDADGVLPVAVGTALWAIAIIVLVIVREPLERADATWWIGVAILGLLGGAGALVFLTWRRRRHS